MRQKKIPYTFEFLEKNRNNVILGVGTRLNPAGYLQLMEDITGVYSTDDDLNVRTWVYNPDSVRGWIGFEVSDAPGLVDIDVVTSIGFRLSDGTTDYYWDEDEEDWVEATDYWNTESEVAENISLFSAESKKLQIVINLKTTDSSATPWVRTIKVLFNSDIELKEDIVFSSFIGACENQIRVKGRHLFRLSEENDELDLKNDYPLETPYNIPEIDGVYNHTDDPHHFVDLFQSFNATTRLITLSSEVDTGKDIWVDFLWVPEFSVSTSLDFNEPEKVPIVILDDLKQIGGAGLKSEDTVVNRYAGQGWKIEYAQCDFQFLIRFMTDKAIDMLRLSDEMRRFFANNLTIRSIGLDREYDIQITSDWDMLSSAGERGLIEANMTVQILRTLFFEKTATAVTTVKKLYFTGDFDQTVG